MLQPGPRPTTANLKSIPKRPRRLDSPLLKDPHPKCYCRLQQAHHRKELHSCGTAIEGSLPVCKRLTSKNGGGLLMRSSTQGQFIQECFESQGFLHLLVHLSSVHLQNTSQLTFNGQNNWGIRICCLGLLRQGL